MKTYIETLREANNRGYTHIEIDGQLREITDIIAADTGDDCGTWTLDDGSIEHLSADGLRTGDVQRLVAEHRISPRYIRNGHSVGVRAGDLSAAHRAALDAGGAVLTADGAIIRARRSSTGRIYYTVRLQPGYRWSDRGSYSKHPTPVRA